MTAIKREVIPDQLPFKKLYTQAEACFLLSVNRSTLSKLMNTLDSATRKPLLQWIWQEKTKYTPKKAIDEYIERGIKRSMEQGIAS